MYVTRTDDQWALLEQADPTVPIVMLNLIRFRQRALDGCGCDGMTGEEAYAEYGRRLRALTATAASAASRLACCTTTRSCAVACGPRHSHARRRSSAGFAPLVTREKR